MSFYAIFGEQLPRLSREYWGTKVQQPDGTMKDTGVNEFVQELLATLMDQGPISLSDTIKLIAPANAPAIQIIGDGGNGDPINIDGFTGSVTVLAGVTIDLGPLTVDTSGLSVNTSGMSVGIGTLAVDINVSGCDVTASLTGTPSLTGSATLTGTATISGTPTVTPQYITLTFANGLLKGIS